MAEVAAESFAVLLEQYRLAAELTQEVLAREGIRGGAMLLEALAVVAARK